MIILVPCLIVKNTVYVNFKTPQTFPASSSGWTGQLTVPWALALYTHTIIHKHIIFLWISSSLGLADTCLSFPHQTHPLMTVNSAWRCSFLSSPAFTASAVSVPRSFTLNESNTDSSIMSLTANRAGKFIASCQMSFSELSGAIPLCCFPLFFYMC